MKTAHDLEQDAAEQERTDFKRVQEVRHELMRECPSGRFLDREHLRVLLSQQPSSNKPWAAWCYCMVHSAVVAMLGASVLGDALGLDAATVKRYRAHDVWWTVDPSRLDRIPEQIRARVIGAR
jgi:hypothetical protein